MKEDTETNTKKKIREEYSLSDSLGESLSANAYKGVSFSANRQMIIWINKHMVGLTTDERDIFLKRLELLHSLKVSPSLTSYDIDADGFGYAIFPSDLRETLQSGTPDINELVRRFFLAVQVMHEIHSKKIVCGDICPDSFRLNRSGSVEYFSVLGLHPAILESELKNLSRFLLQFCAPEVLSSHILDLRSDVYSLGILGIYLLTGKDPVDVDPESGRPLFSLSPALSADLESLPSWLVTVLKKSVSFNPEERYASATELLEALAGAREKALQGPGVFGKNRASKEGRGMLSKALILRPIQKPATGLPDIYKQTLADKVARILSSSKFLVGSIILFVVIVGSTVLILQRGAAIKAAEDARDAAMPFTAGNSDLTDAVNTINSVTEEEQKKIAELDRLIDLADPLVYSLIFSNLRSATSEVIARNAERVLFARVEKNGLPLAAEQARQWARYTKVLPAEGLYEQVVKVIDPNAPIADRLPMLQELFKTDNNIATRLTGALFFDLKHPQEFYPLVKAELGKSSGNNYDLSAFGIIILHQGLVETFAAEMDRDINKVTDSDLRNLMLPLARRDDFLLTALIKQAVNRKILPELDLLILSYASNSEVGIPVRKVLTKLAVAGLEKGDINTLSTWHNPDLPLALLVAAVKEKDPEQLRTYIATAAAQNPTFGISEGLIGWSKNSHWEDLLKVGHSLAVLCLSKYFEESQVFKAVSDFAPYFSEDRLLEVLLTAEDDRIVSVILKNFSAELSLPQKLNLLNNPQKKVRLAVIPTIDSNDLGASRIIIDHYDQEQDSEVRSLYKKTFWFLEKRF